MRRLILALILALAQAAGTQPAAAQEKATLVADSVALESTTLLVASGHVEIFYKGARVTASKVSYDAGQDRLRIEGPILIDDGKGTVITAEVADLSADLTEGLIQTARLVLQQQLQMTATEIRRSEGGQRTELAHVAASSCKVCGNGPPLWEIRAARVVHDAAAQQVWFNNATLRFAGVPVIWLPALRIPDPSLKRATGFLMPKLQSSTALGTGISLPYFITLGPSRDLTLTPFLTNQSGRTLGWRYRQAFSAGTLEVAGAFSRDRRIEGETRGYLQAKGAFDLGGGWTLGLDGTVVSDPAYLQDYGISDDDRLNSSVSLSRVTRDRYTQASLTALRTLRTTESNATQPSALAGMTTQHRFTPALLGGQGLVYGEAVSVRRSSHLGTDGDGDGVADGRDLTRASVGVDWTRRWITGQGLVLDAGLQGGVDLYSISEDDTYGGAPARSLGRAGLRLSYPMVRKTEGGTLYLEPGIQLVHAATATRGAIPDEDSRLVEFDQGNLYSLDRFPGADRVETGTRLNMGLAMGGEAQDGNGWGVVLGRVWRLDSADPFTAPTGLGTKLSDWLVAGQVTLAQPGGRAMTVTTRAMIADDLSLTRFESRFALTTPRFGMAGGYEFVGADPDQGRDQDVREIVLNTTARLGDFWTLTASDRYDLSTETTRASLGLGFRNECLAVDLSVSRRFTSSSIVAPSSDVGLTVELLGLGGASAGQAATTCRR